MNLTVPSFSQIRLHVPDGYKADTFIARKALFKRPFCDDFLKFLFQNFNVGVWSSRTKRNVDSVVDFVMGDMKKNLLFCWDQYHCTDTGYSTLENRQKPLVLKELKKLWNKHDRRLPWKKGAYNESNTILLDDSPYKALRNPPRTAIFPPPYRFEDAGDKSLGPGGDLRVYLEGLLKAEDVQNYVEQHRFGQRAITDKNPSWEFYRRIIGRNVQTRADIRSTSKQLQMVSISFALPSVANGFHIMVSISVSPQCQSYAVAVPMIDLSSCSRSQYQWELFFRN